MVPQKWKRYGEQLVWRKGRRTQGFCFRYVRFEVPIGNPSGNVYQATGYVILELRTEIGFKT